MAAIQTESQPLMSHPTPNTVFIKRWVPVGQDLYDLAVLSLVFTVTTVV